MTMITFKANVMVTVHVHCISMIQKEFHSTVFTNFLFTGVRENKGRGDGVRKEEVMVCASNIITYVMNIFFSQCLRVHTANARC